MQEPAAPNSQPIGRRAADQQNDRVLADILSLNLEIRDRVIALEGTHKHVSEAFVKDDLGQPDYHGHRKAHLQMIKDTEVVAGYKQDATKRIIGFVIAAVLGMLAAGFIEALRR